MTSTTTALTTKVESGSPYQLNPEQVLKASTALLKHLKSTEQDASKTAAKQSLLADAEEEDDQTSEPIWLNLTTKKHIIDQKRLKPAKIALPHPLNTSSNSKICLITADPQRTYKDIVASPAFPAALSARITKVVGISKIKKKWSQYEAQRKLLAEYDIFVADDRIITNLPKHLGKTFYKSTTKRPIPVSIAAPAPRTEGKRLKRAKDDTATRGAASPKDIAAEIEKAITGALVHLSPSTNTSVRVGYAHWAPEKLAENITAVSEALIEKFVPKQWRGLKALHIKSPNSAALPIWLSDELWVDEADVLAEEQVKAIEDEKKANIGKKRKRILDEAKVEETTEMKVVKAKKQKVLVESNDDKLDEEIAARKESLRKQKAAAAEDGVDIVPKVAKVKKTKKAKKEVSA